MTETELYKKEMQVMKMKNDYLELKVEMLEKKARILDDSKYKTPENRATIKSNRTLTADLSSFSEVTESDMSF